MASSKVRSESRTDLVPDVDISPKDSEVVNAGHQPSYGSQSYDTQSFGSQSLSTPRCLDVYPSLEMTSDRPTSHMFAAVLTCLALNIVFGPPALLCAITARRAIKRNNLVRAKQYSDAALAFSCLGLASSLIAVALVIIFVVI